VFIQITTVHSERHWTSESCSRLVFPIIKVTFWLYSGVWKCFMLRWQRELISAQCHFSIFDCRLFIFSFFQFAFCLSLSLSVISTSLSQTFCKCCNLSVSVVLNLCDSPWTRCAWRTTPIHKWREQAETEWAQRVIFMQPKCEPLHTCCPGFPVRAGLKCRGPGAIFTGGPLWRISWRYRL